MVNVDTSSRYQSAPRSVDTSSRYTSSSSSSSSSSKSSSSSSSSSSSKSSSSDNRYNSNATQALIAAMSSGSSGSSSSSSSGSSSGSSTTASFYNPGGVTVSKGSSLNIASGSGGGSNYTSYSSGSLSSKSSSGGSLSSGSSSGSGSYTVRLDSYTTGGNSQTYSVTDNSTGKTTVTAFAGISPEALAQYDAARGNYSAAAMETAIAKYASDNQLSEKYGDKTGVNYYNWDGWSYNAQTGKVDKPDNAIVSTGTYFLDGNGTMETASAISSASYNVSNSGGTLTASSSGVSSGGGLSTGLSVVGSGNNQSVGGGGIGGAVLGGVDWVLNGVDSIGEQGIGGQILQTGIEFLAPLDAVRLGEKLAKGEETNFWDYFLAGVDALAFIPVFGWVAKGAKTAIKAAVGIGTVAGGIGQGISEANKLIAEDTAFTDSLENNVIDTMRGDTTIILDKSDTKENVFRSNTSKIIGDSNLTQSAKLTNNQGVVEQQDKDNLDISDALNNVFNGTFYDNPDNYGSVSGGSGVTINTMTSGGSSISDIIERAKPYLPIIGAVVVILIVIGASKKRRTYG